MTIQDLVSIVLSKIKIIILFTVLGGLVAFGVSNYLMVPTYSSNVRLYVKSSTNTTNIGTTTNTELDTAKSLANTYKEILIDTSTCEKIGEKFAEEYNLDELAKNNIPVITNKKTGEKIVSPSYIQSCISISAVDETEILSVSATTTIPQISADMCNYMLEVAPDILKKVVNAGSVEAINEPSVPTTPVSPNVKKITVMGAMVGLIGCAAVVILIRFFNNKVTTAADLKDKFGVPILAEIPTFDSKLKKGAYKK